jgi:hypothetical protein
MRVHPYYPPWILQAVARACFHAERYKEAIIFSREGIKRFPNLRRTLDTWMILIASLIAEGKEQDAQAETTAFLKEQPNFSIERWLKIRAPMWNPIHMERLAGNLHQAGLPE